MTGKVEEMGDFQKTAILFSVVTLLIVIVLPAQTETEYTKTQDTNIYQVLSMAHILVNRDDTEGAITGLDIVLEKYPENLRARILKAIVRDMEGDENSSQELNRIIEENINDTNLIIYTIDKLNFKEEYETSLSILDRSIRNNDQEIRILRKRAQTLNKMGEYEQSLESIEYALTIDPEDLRSLMMKGGIMNNLGNYDSARDIGKRILADNPESEVGLDIVRQADEGMKGRKISP